MPRIANLKKVVILGSGPIVIGQACEFDYSGTQACKALMREGLEVILINSNPATIMTDPELATRVYIEPLTVPFVEKILEKEKPDAVIPTLGGQTALNLALQLADQGILQRLGVKLLGADPKVIRAAEDRETFRSILDTVGAKYPRSEMVRNFAEAQAAAEKLGTPLILRPNYTLGGGGGGIAYTIDEYESMITKALKESPTSEVLVEESILGWKEFELEVMRDHKGTFVIICSIENLDPCGVHTGDSITIAPQQTLTDRQYQDMRDEARRIIEAVGLATGGANIQFAVHPTTGERVVIEMNPRVSRSSALASKATGFPIAKIAALLAVGYELEEIRNDITKSTPSCYEPALDYVVTKIPRFAFEKFPGSKDELTTQMKSVGEVMGIGRTFKESLMKALSSLESRIEGFAPVPFSEKLLSHANSQRIFHLAQAFREGWTVDQVYQVTQITPWFLEQIEDIIQLERKVESESELTRDLMLKAKRTGFTDSAIAQLRQMKAQEVRAARHGFGLRPGYSQVDTCAGEFKSETPYYYSSYWVDPALSPAITAQLPRVVVLGSGPNRIGQGIEFDYSCVRAVKRFQQEGRHVVMINSNPETVSTDYDTSDELYFEPLTEESVLEILDRLKPEGFVAQLGGQTPINLAQKLVRAGHRLMGSSLDSIDLAEDRGRFSEVCRELNLKFKMLKIPASGMAGTFDEAEAIAGRIGYPVICRPSYVLGGRRMEVVESVDELWSYFERHGDFISKEEPCLMDQFLAGALEVDVDLVRGEDWAIVGGIVEHIEAAGVHSGDSMGVLPPQRLKDETTARIEELALALANRLGTIGHLNLQLAVKDDEVYMLEANPRSSRSVPFVSKATRIPLVDLGVWAMLGRKAKEVQPTRYKWRDVRDVSVKGVVFPFKKFPESDSILGPEMKSTGESMGRGEDYAEALLKASIASHIHIPPKGEVLLSLRDKDKTEMLPLVRSLVGMGYQLSATSGTAKFLYNEGIDCVPVKKVHEGRPNCVDRIRSGQVALVINTTSGRRAVEASFAIRRSCIDFSIHCITESHAAEALLTALRKHRTREFSVSAQDKMI
ncbi:MAG TPA: carbamoyl-phosphate synthase large subunit [Pseudobdellovibrionaceae bacterium]|nr:carbamoyl-phosphate synthase large subunit [Pseudobdellovibrionaceae bacterium]